MTSEHELLDYIFLFYFPLLYGIPSLLLYIILVRVLYKERRQLSKDFYYLFMISSIANWFIFLNNFLFTRLPRILEPGQDLYNFFVNLPTFVILCSVWLTVEGSIVNVAMILLICSYRFTAVAFPNRHSKIWKECLWPSLILTWILPCGASCLAFWNDTGYTYVESSKLFGLANTPLRNVMWSVQMYATTILSILTTIINIIAFIITYRAPKDLKQSNTQLSFENKLLVITIVNGILMLLALIPLDARVVITNDSFLWLYARFGQTFYDFFILNHPYTYFIVSPKSRSVAWNLILCRRGDEVEVINIKGEAHGRRTSSSIIVVQ